MLKSPQLRRFFILNFESFGNRNPPPMKKNFVKVLIFDFECTIIGKIKK
nr:MAG TPA: HAD-like protein [Myoviridae sp. ctTS62]